MFNSLDNNGWTQGLEVVKYKGMNWLVVGEGKDYITIETDFSYDPNYREYSCAVMKYSCVEQVTKNVVEPFCTIIMKNDSEEAWDKEYKKCGLMFEESFVNESCCE